MAEYVTIEEQLVDENSNILFKDTTVCGSNSIVHRPGSGLITLRGITMQNRARFKITFGGNLAVPGAGTAQEMSVAIAINGEPIQSTIMRATPADEAQYLNVGRSLYIDIPACCCSQISVKNTSGIPIYVQNASIIVERVA